MLQASVHEGVKGSLFVGSADQCIGGLRCERVKQRVVRSRDGAPKIGLTWGTWSARRVDQRVRLIK